MNILRKSGVVTLITALLLQPTFAVAAVPDVEMIPQKPDLPTGCEVASLTMLLRWAGWEVTKNEVAGWVKRQPPPYQRQGLWYGGDPHLGFVG
jgi:uncharacterized protein YvpB